MQSLETIQIAIDHFVATVTLATPKKGNPFGPELWGDIKIAFDALSENESVRAIVLTANGANFSYGLDLMATAPLLGQAVASDDPPAGIRDIAHPFQQAFDAIAHCSQPVIAVVQGWCIGAGVELAAACDFRYGSRDAKFSLREVKVGIVPDVGGIQRLPYIIGEGHLREIALTGGDYDADWAVKTGLLNDVFELSEDAAEYAHEVARTIASNPPAVVRGIKASMNTRIDPQIQAGLSDALERNTTLLQMSDFMEAVTAFIERREPNFTGK